MKKVRDGEKVNTITAILLFVLSGLIAIVNVNIDDRVMIFVFITWGMAIYGLAQIIGYFDGGEIHNVIIPTLVILINYAIAIKLRKIPAVEKPRFKKKSLIIIFPMYMLVLYSNMEKMKDMQLTELILTLFVSIFVAFFFYFWIRECIFAYLLLWVHYFFGKEYVYTDKEFRTEVTRCKSSYNYYFIIDGRKLSISNEMIKRYCGNKFQGKFKKTMRIKKSIVSKRLMITEIC